MNIAPHIMNVAHVIQLAVAPVFLLSGVGVTLTVFTSRLARIIDRTRVLEDRLPQADDAGRADIKEQLKWLVHRSRWIERAIACSTITGLLICLLIIGLFADELLEVDLSALIALLFVISMMTFVFAFISFLRETWLATLRIRTSLN